MKLGELLIERGVITGDQLEMALTAQLFFGGHLGTSLIELNLLDEEALGEALAISARVPYAPRHFLANIDPAAIKTVPRKIAEEYRVVPFKLDGKSVHLAFLNPRDLQALDALRFATGRGIVAWIAPEVRIFQALEKYYGVQRSARYVKLDYRLNSPSQTPARPEPATPAPSKEEFVSFSSESPETAFGYGRPWQEIAAELFLGDSSGPESPTVLMSLPELADRYCHAETRDDLARSVLDFAALRADRMLLMFVRGNWASVWDERGFSLARNTRSEVVFDVTSDALFRLPLGNDHFQGALPENHELRSFYDRLGVDAPEELLLVPVHVNDRLVAVALADGGPKGRLRGGVDEILKALRLFSTAVLMVALRKNLRDVARPLRRGAEA